MPSNWLSALLFTILIAPGLVFDLLSSTRYTRAKESAFREVSRITLSATVFSSAGLAAAAWASHEHPGVFLDLDATLRVGWAYVADNQIAAAWSLGLAMGVAVALALIVDCLLRLRASKLVLKSAWTLAFKPEWPSNRTQWLRETVSEPVRKFFTAHRVWVTGPRRDAYVTIVLSDGSSVRGTVLYFTSDHEIGERELVLQKPIQILAPNQPAGTHYATTKLEAMVLKSEDIVRIGVRYPQRDSDAELVRGDSSGVPRRRWWRFGQRGDESGPQTPSQAVPPSDGSVDGEQSVADGEFNQV